MSKKITVTIEGQITDYNKKLYNERLAIALLKQYGEVACKDLLRQLEMRDKMICQCSS